MKILLMVPLNLGLSKGDRPSFADLGLGYLATALKQKGHEVFIHGWNKKNSEAEFLSYLHNINPGLVGMKVFTRNMSDAVASCEIIKQALPNSTIVVGGPHPSASPPHETMADFSSVDFAFQGDAETGLPMLCKAISQKENFNQLQDIPGLIWRESDKIRHNPNLLTTNLDELGFPDWELLDLTGHLPPTTSRKQLDGIAAPISITRGCPAKCTFCCAHKVAGYSVRARSPRHVMEEIRLLYNKYQVRHFFITDTNFLYYKELVEELCNLIIQEGLNIRFDAPTGPAWDILDDKLLPLLKKAGCNMIGLGIESGSPRIRKLIKKQPESISDVKKTVDQLKNNGIGVAGYFLIGFPEESPEDIKKTIDLAFSLKLDSRSFEIVYPLPGTPLYEQIKSKYGLSRIDWKNFDITYSPYHLGTVNTKELRRYLSRAYFKMLFNPKFICRSLFGQNTLGTPKLFLKRALLYRC